MHEERDIQYELTEIQSRLFDLSIKPSIDLRRLAGVIETLEEIKKAVKPN